MKAKRGSHFWNNTLLIFLVSYLTMYFIFVVSAFYVSGVHLESADAILYKNFGPITYYPYKFGFIISAWGIGILTILWMNGLLIIVGLLAFLSYRRWTTYSTRRKWLNVVIGLAALLTVLFSKLPLGYLIAEWMLD